MRELRALLVAGALCAALPALADGPEHGRGETGGPVKVTTPVLTRVYEFHGHLGPYVVLGYRAGLIGRERLKSPGYFDLTAKVESPLKPPASCFVDGVQLGSGCTLGKRNIEVRESTPLQMKVTFTTKAGRSVVVALQKDVSVKLARWIAEVGLEKAARRALEADPEQLFTIYERKVERPK
jgi:formylmethanofuran dehydrogenase subunit E